MHNRILLSLVILENRSGRDEVRSSEPTSMWLNQDWESHCLALPRPESKNRTTDDMNTTPSNALQVQGSILVQLVKEATSGPVRSKSEWVLGTAATLCHQRTAA